MFKKFMEFGEPFIQEKPSLSKIADRFEMFEPPHQQRTDFKKQKPDIKTYPRFHDI